MYIRLKSPECIVECIAIYVLIYIVYRHNVPFFENLGRFAATIAERATRYPPFFGGSLAPGGTQYAPMHKAVFPCGTLVFFGVND